MVGLNRFTGTQTSPSSIPLPYSISLFNNGAVNHLSEKEDKLICIFLLVVFQLPIVWNAITVSRLEGVTMTSVVNQVQSGHGYQIQLWTTLGIITNPLKVHLAQILLRRIDHLARTKH